MGFCPQCQSSTGLSEARERPKSTKRVAPVPVAKVGESDVARARTDISEFDRVLGGGFVPGGVVLLGGEPGVGKSTLLLQVAGAMVATGGKVLIATAEESADQVGLRAARLGIDSDDVLVLADDDIDAVIEAAASMRPELLVVDSVQTMSTTDLGAAPGSVGQVRECSARLIRFAKDRGVATVLVGHVTKDGSIAGPKLLEHMVDVVLYLEGETDRGFRTVHGLKNRFGATHLVGLFEMGNEGLLEVPDPSRAFVGEWEGGVPGTVIFPTISGRRALLVEVQALVGQPTSAPTPRRSVRGVEAARVHQLLAVLERHAGLRFADREVYVSAVGGMRLAEPGADLAVALALASSLTGAALGSTAAWGEVGLTGELRSVSHDARRAAEAGRLGLRNLVHPNGGPRRLDAALMSAGLLASGVSAP